jgi:hypothetical protein
LKVVSKVRLNLIDVSLLPESNIIRIDDIYTRAARFLRTSHTSSHLLSRCTLKTA